MSGSRNETGVGLGVKLDSGLNNINGGDTTVSKRAADTTSKGTLKVVCGVVHLRARRGRKGTLSGRGSREGSALLVLRDIERVGACDGGKL